MKKFVIVIILAMMVLFTLSGCMLTKEEKFKVNEVKELLLDVIDSFGEAQYMDDDWSSADDAKYYGEINVLLVNEDDLIGKMLLDDNIFIIVEIAFDEYADINMNESAIWNIMITYVDFESRDFIYLDYYIYDNLFRPNMDNEIIDYSFDDFVEILSMFKTKDWLELVESIIEEV